MSPAGVLLRCHAPPAAAATPTAVPRLWLRPHVFKVTLCPSPKGERGGGAEGEWGTPPLIVREASTTSINDAPQQSLLQRPKPRTGQPTTRREAGFDVWVLARFLAS
jgi:hypothetical protein